MLIRAPGTLALISETSWALQCLIGALPAGRVCTRRAGGHLHGWHSETKKQHWRLFCVYIQFWVFPPKSFFWSWWWFSCLADPFWALGRLQLFALRCFGGGHNPRSSRQCTHSYFLQLEAFARVKKKKSEAIVYLRWEASSELHLFLITGFHLSYHVGNIFLIPKCCGKVISHKFTITFFINAV